VSAIERQVDDFLVVDYGPDTGILRIQQWRRTGDLYGLSERSDLQTKVKPRGLLYLQLHRRPHLRLEALHLHSNVIQPRSHLRKTIVTRCVSDRLTREVILRVSDRDFSSRYYGSR